MKRRATAKPTSGWKQRLASMSEAEAEAYKRRDRERTKAYRARQAAIAKGEVPPSTQDVTVAPGDGTVVDQERFDVERPIRAFKVGDRVTFRNDVTRQETTWEIKRHYADAAGTEVVERSAKVRTFVVKRPLDVDGDKEVTFVSQGGRSTVISSNTPIVAVVRAPRG